MKIIEIKDLIIIASIIILLFCLFKKPVKEYLDNKDSSSCPKGCSSQTQISINHTNITDLQNKVSGLEKGQNTNKTNLSNFIKKYNDTLKSLQKGVTSK